MAIPQRRKMLVVRLAALIKNLEKYPDDFTLDKQLDKTIAKLEKFYRHSSQTRNYREAMKLEREQKAAEQVDEEVEDGVQEEVTYQAEAKEKVNERIS